MEPVFVFLSLFATIFGIAYVFLSTRNRERLALIEKGADASLFERKGTKFSIAKFILNIALLLVGIGTGILVGNVIHVSMGIKLEISLVSMLFVFGGIGLIAGYVVTRRIEKADNQ